MFNTMVEIQAHGHDAVATLLIGERLRIGTAFREGHIAPLVAITSKDRVGDEVLVGVVNGQV